MSWPFMLSLFTLKMQDVRMNVNDVHFGPILGPDGGWETLMRTEVVTSVRENATAHLAAQDTMQADCRGALAVLAVAAAVGACAASGPEPAAPASRTQEARKGAPMLPPPAMVPTRVGKLAVRDTGTGATSGEVIVLWPSILSDHRADRKFSAIAAANGPVKRRSEERSHRTVVALRTCSGQVSSWGHQANNPLRPSDAACGGP